MKIFKIAIMIVLAAVSLLYIVYPIVLGLYVLARHPSTVGQPPKGFDNVTLNTAEGIKLAAWYAPPENGAVIILIHGGAGSRNGIRPYAEMLVDNGFGVFAFDLQGHGESEGAGNAFAWKATQDIGEVVEYLQKQDEVKYIGGLGVSLGGEVLLSSASTYPEIKAVVSDGATHRSIDDYVAVPEYNSFIGSWVQRVMYTTVRVFRGGAKPVPILESIKDAQETSLLLIAAGGVDDEIKYNTVFHNAVSDRSQLWVVPRVGHISAYYNYQDEYEEKVISFFEENLLGQ
jgi:esterase/lipase